MGTPQLCNPDGQMWSHQGIRVGVKGGSSHGPEPIQLGSEAKSGQLVSEWN